MAFDNETKDKFFWGTAIFSAWLWVTFSPAFIVAAIAIFVVIWGLDIIRYNPT